MIWHIEYSAKAKEDLSNIADYLTYVLFTPDSARKIVSTILGEIEALTFMPSKFSYYPHEPWYSQHIRFFPVKKYNVLYYEDESTGIINIVRIMYASRDVAAQFDESF